MVITEAARFNVVDCGRRWGKTTLGEDRLVTPDTLKHPMGWFSPTYKMLLEVWRELRSILAPITSRSNVQERRIELTTGGVIDMWSLDKPDVARGRKYKRIVVDEAAMVPGLMDTWNKVLRPTLADMAGDAWFLSTPKGHNAFWQMYQWGLDDHKPDWACWQLPTSANPYIPASEIEAMRNSMPAQVFAQEVMAEFIDDAGGVFRGVLDAATLEPLDPVDGHEYVFGVDWGKLNDFTVIWVVDTTTSEAVFVDRFNQIDYRFQVERLQALYDKYRPFVIVAEENSMGVPVIERLYERDMPVFAFKTTNASKKEIIERLANAFERQTIKMVNDPVTVGELQAFESERLPSGMFRYAAPEGMHDDTVMALALAWSRAGVDYWVTW